MLCGIGRRLYSKPGAALPTVGTDDCGFARNGIVSADSQGSILGCCLKSVNQLQAPRSITGNVRHATRDTRHATRELNILSRVADRVSRVASSSTFTADLL